MSKLDMDRSPWNGWVVLLLLCAITTGLARGEFQPNWDSLKEYRCPEWYRDAKFGIFICWGMEAVPGSAGGNDGWYARHMYMQTGAPDWGDHTYGFHVEHFGHPSEFGWKDFAPMWKADNWDPDALVGLFKKVGARYVAPIAVHHGNFDNYDSTYQPWNSVEMGPKRDVIGEWKRACDKHGLRFGVTSHSARAWRWLEPAHGADVKGPKEGVPYDGNLTEKDGQGKWWEGYDPRDLYCRPHESGQGPDTAYREKWFKRTKELVDKYQPDLLYFDGGLPLGRYGLRIASHFYNSNMKRNDGHLEAVLTLKSMPVSTAAVRDYERGQSSGLRELPWQTDTTLESGWFYQKGVPLRLDAAVVVDTLVDIVSKNGNLLLNVGLWDDGRLPEEQKGVLLEVGRWLEVNGRAIYGTRPWKIFGEGPSKVSEGHFKERTVDSEPYEAQDIRFTTRGDILYAIALAWPEDRRLTIRSLAEGGDYGFGEVKRVELLGRKSPLKCSRDENGLVVHMPESKPCEHAFALRVTPVE